MKQAPYKHRRGRLHRHGRPAKRRSLHVSRANMISQLRRQRRKEAA